MTTLYKYENKLIRTAGGGLAKDPACCCECVCECTDGMPCAAQLTLSGAIDNMGEYGNFSILNSSYTITAPSPTQCSPISSIPSWKGPCTCIMGINLPNILSFPGGITRDARVTFGLARYQPGTSQCNAWNNLNVCGYVAVCGKDSNNEETIWAISYYTATVDRGACHTFAYTELAGTYPIYWYSNPPYWPVYGSAVLEFP